MKHVRSELHNEIYRLSHLLLIERVFLSTSQHFYPYTIPITMKAVYTAQGDDIDLFTNPKPACLSSATILSLPNTL